MTKTTRERQPVSLLDKTIRSVKRNGMRGTLVKVLHYPVTAYYRIKLNRLLKAGTPEEIFTEIYVRNHWGNAESVSGDGSTLSYTENLRRELPRLFRQFSINTIFDAPCGDFSWMRHVLADHEGLSYIGGDIVKTLIDDHNARFRNERIEFVHIDLVADPFPPADLMICRDCLFHLSFRDTQSVLAHFLDSRTPYLLTTTHKPDQAGARNADIRTGDFRRIYLCAEPYCFPADAVFRIDDGIGPDYERELCLWTRDQVATALAQLRTRTPDARTAGARSPAVPWQRRPG